MVCLQLIVVLLYRNSCYLQFTEKHSEKLLLVHIYSYAQNNILLFSIAHYSSHKRQIQPGQTAPTSTLTVYHSVSLHRQTITAQFLMLSCSTNLISTVCCTLAVIKLQCGPQHCTQAWNCEQCSSASSQTCHSHNPPTHPRTAKSSVDKILLIWQQKWKHQQRPVNPQGNRIVYEETWHSVTGNGCRSSRKLNKWSKNRQEGRSGTEYTQNLAQL